MGRRAGPAAVRGRALQALQEIPEPARALGLELAAGRDLDAQARTIGSAKQALQRAAPDDLTARRGLAQLALAVLAAPLHKKLCRVAARVLELRLPGDAGGVVADTLRDDPAWLEAADRAIASALHSLRHGRNDDGEAEHDPRNLALGQLFGCEPIRALVLTRVPATDLLEALRVALVRLRDETLSSTAGDGAAADQADCSAALDGPVNLLADLLDQLICHPDCTEQLTEPLSAHLCAIRDQVCLDLLRNPVISSTFVFKPLRNHLSVVLLRATRLLCNVAAAPDAPHKLLHDAVFHLAMPPPASHHAPSALTSSTAVTFLRDFAETSVGPEVTAILLHQALANLSPAGLFHRPDASAGEDPTPFAEAAWVALRRLSDEHVFNETLQTACLKGMDEWCKTLQQGLCDPAARAELWSVWRTSARECTLGLVQFVLENWSHGSRKARFHLEPLLLTALSLANFVRLELPGLAPELDQQELAEESALLVLAHQQLVGSLAQQVIQHDPEGRKTNLKAALPIIVEICKTDGIMPFINADSRFLSSLFRSFPPSAHVSPRLAAGVFELAAKDLHDKGLPRSTWLAPLAAALVDDNKDIADAVSTMLLPKLVRTFPDLDTDVILAALPGQPDLRHKVTLWGAFQSGGADLCITTEAPPSSERGVVGVHSTDQQPVILIPQADLRAALTHADPAVVVKALDLLLPRRHDRLQLPSAPQLQLAKDFFTSTPKWPHSTMRYRVLQVAGDLFEYLRAAFANGKLLSADPAGAQRAVEFCHWFARHAVSAAYPTAPMDRSALGLELLQSMLAPLSGARGDQALDRIRAQGLTSPLAPLLPGGDMHSADNSFALVNMLMNTYEKVQDLAFTVLDTLPAPFAGLESRAQLEKWIEWIVLLLGSTRVRDADAGASMMRLLFRKYVCDLGMAIDVPSSPYPSWRPWAARLSRSSDADVVDSTHAATAETVASDIGNLVEDAIMHLACSRAEQCTNAEKAYNVGAIIVDGRGEMLATGFSRELPGNTHAEETALMKLGGQFAAAAPGEDVGDVALGRATGTTVYSTMEPCSVRLSGNRPCTSRCIAAGVSRVVVGVREPSKFVTCTGTQELRDAGIRVDYLTNAALQRRCMEPNMFLFPDEHSPFTAPTAQELAQFQAQADGRDLPRDLAKMHFVWQLVGLLETRVAALAAGSGNVNVFGLLRSIRFCLEDAQSEISPRWRQLIERLVQVVFRGLATAMMVVASAPAAAGGDREDEPDEAGDPANLGGSDTIKVDSTIKVACDGHVVITGPVTGLDGDCLDKDQVEAARRVVMSSWLMIRDGGFLLQSLVEVCPLQTRRDEDNEPGEFLLSFDQVDQIGGWMLQALGSLKHVGAIGSVTNALQGVCTRLLALRRGKQVGEGHLIELPRKWLDQLLVRIESGTQGFVLRRSSGTAGAFLALARSEPRAHKSVLLGEMMRRLLARANGADEWLGTRVHAMNIIKAIVEDSTLQEDIEGDVISQAMILAVRGFGSPHWQERNSAMMIFAKVVKRIVGITYQADDRTVGNRVAAPFVFRRYPQIHSALLEGIASAAGAPTHSLFPWLLFLARMEPRFLVETSVSFLRLTPPPEGDAGREGHEAVLELIPMLGMCLGQPQGMVRAMAARAQASLTPNDFLVPNLLALLATLAQHPDADGAAMARERNHNLAHGRLLAVFEHIQTLALRRLLERAVQPTSPEVAEDGTVKLGELLTRVEGDLCEALSVTLEWINPGCQVVREMVWAILEAWLAARREQSPVFPVSPGLLGIVRSAPPSDARACALACTLDFRLDVLASDDPRSRLGALRALARRFSLNQAECTISLDSEDVAASLEPLAAALATVTMATVEPYPPEQALRLALLAAVLRAGHGVGAAYAKELAAHLDGLLEKDLAPRARGPALVARAALVGVAGPLNAENLLSAAAPTACDTLRAAAVLALPTSLQQTPASAPAAWAALVHLLQDEVDEVRAPAVMLAHGHVPSLKESAYPVCESRALAATVEYARSTMAPVQFPDLAKVLSVQRATPVDLGLLDGELFELEPDNVYAEPLELNSLVGTWLSSPLGDSELAALMEVQDATLWPGGVSFHPELHEALVAALRAAPHEDASPLRAALARFGSGSPLHPRIRALL